MKNRKFVLFAVFSALCLFNLQAQTSADDELPAEIVAAFQSGSARTVGAYFTDNVELVIESRGDIYSRQQATGILSNFFAQGKTVSFKILHQSSKNAVGFAIGELTTDKGSYRVTVNLRKKQINKLIIEKI